jgi:hypothetical protein
MSENLDLVRSICACWERGDFSSAEWAHAEVELVFADGPETGSWTGRTAMAQGMREFLTSWAEWQVEADDYRELDDERVLALVHHSGRGRMSGLELGQIGGKGAVLFDIHDGMVTRSVIYFDRAQALADLGLKE